eukprot:TRINITY_DN220_c4_g1_i1.p1 TRINITY_DN220_c4_g1~~TRINITY_DN220_c4_g1_i1.p1  ORF type:complete len:696 (-),score=212.35 TRINITY_DN220_c4_g1_i1:555-2546(-)
MEADGSVWELVQGFLKHSMVQLDLKRGDQEGEKDVSSEVDRVNKEEDAKKEDVEETSSCGTLILGGFLAVVGPAGESLSIVDHPGFQVDEQLSTLTNHILHLNVISLDAFLQHDISSSSTVIIDRDTDTCEVRLIPLPLLQAQQYFKWNLRHVSVDVSSAEDVIEKKPTRMGGEGEEEEKEEKETPYLLVVDPNGVHPLNEIHQTDARKKLYIGSLVITISGEMVGFLVPNGIALLQNWAEKHGEAANALTHRFSLWKAIVGSGYFQTPHPEETATENTKEEQEKKEKKEKEIECDLEYEQMRLKNVEILHHHKVIRQDPRDSCGPAAKAIIDSSPVNILCIDGGGTRAAIAVSILLELVAAVPDMLSHFDLICGTSAGGFLATGILCGRDPSTFPSFVDSFAKDTFDVPLWREAVRFVSRESRYSQTSLRKLIHDNFETSSDLHSMSDLDQRIGPRAHGFVVSTLANQCQWKPFLFRTYSHAGSVLPGSSEASIQTALLATSAAPSYFPALIVDRSSSSTSMHTEEAKKERFLDGGLVANNPSQYALIEARSMWPHRPIGMLVSIGTGQPPREKAGSSLISFLEQSIDVSTGSELIALEVRAMMRAILPESLLLRFSPPDLGRFDLATHSRQKLQEMRDQTEQYLKTKEVQTLISRFKKYLS